MKTDADYVMNGDDVTFTVIFLLVVIIIKDMCLKLKESNQK